MTNILSTYLDPIILGIFSILVIPLALAYGLKKWSTSKGEHSVFAGQDGLEEIGISAAGGLFNRSTIRRTDGMTELRSTWGFVLLVPILVALVVFAAPWSVFWDSLGISDPKIISGICVAVGLMVLYVWVWQGFFHVVKYDDYQISVVDDMFRTQKAEMKDLQSVNGIAGRPLTELIFKGGQKMKIVNTISHRKKFMADMLERVEFNEKFPGKTPPRKPDGAPTQNKRSDGDDGMPTTVRRF